ncbi:MAG: dihydrodipicolinate synthase family protein [Rhodospirillales bacterium]
MTDPDPAAVSPAVDDRLHGVFAAALTPVDAHLAPDFGTATLHCRWLLRHGCDGLGILGTTGEANSFSVGERTDLLDHLVGNGVPAAVLLPGTGCAALTDTVALTAHACKLGAGGCLVLPPFYYKNVSDDGLFASYAEVIERVGDPRLRIYLYHFPQMTGLFLSVALIERLVARYPETVVGIKDSSGDLANMLAVAAAIPGFAVFSGSDDLLLPLLDGGGAGCITACCNIAAPLAAAVYAAWRNGDRENAAAVQRTLSEVRRLVSAYPLSAALKALFARFSPAGAWAQLRPPLVPLPPAAAAALADALAALPFAPDDWP